MCYVCKQTPVIIFQGLGHFDWLDSKQKLPYFVYKIYTLNPVWHKHIYICYEKRSFSIDDHHPASGAGVGLWKRATILVFIRDRVH